MRQLEDRRQKPSLHGHQAEHGVQITQALREFAPANELEMEAIKLVLDWS